jgi:hypothetical protein
VSELVFTDNEQVYRHRKPLQGTIEPDHLLIVIGHGWLDHEQINVAMVIGIAAGI